MQQPNSAPYISNSYPNMMDLPVSHVPFRSASNGSTTPDSRQHSLDESSYFNTVPHEILNLPVTRVAESSLDLWLLDIPGTASPESSRLSISPSQGIATPPSDSFYSPLYSEQLQTLGNQLLEQPQPLRSYSASHPNWVNGGENWEYNYPESDIWSTQPFVVQPWIPSPYDGYTPPNMASGHAHVSNGALPPFTYAAPSQFPAPEAIQTGPAASNAGSPFSEDSNEDEDSSDEESNWYKKASNYSQAKASASKAKPKTRSSRPHIDRWSVSVNNIQHSETRGHVCDVPQCGIAFVRPEHLSRHVRSKHSATREFGCKVPECNTLFSRSDNLRDHYWTHLHRGGRAGKNKKMTLPELKVIIGPKDKKLIRRLREKLRQHHEKEKLKEQRVARPAYIVRSLL